MGIYLEMDGPSRCWCRMPIFYAIHCIWTCILVQRKIKDKSVHTSALEAQVTDVCTGHQTGFIVGINCVKTRQEISKHISIAYNMLYWTMRIFAV